MPTQKLPEKVEDQVRKYLVDALRPAEIEGYDPTQGDTTAQDYILITSDNDNYGDYYPLIYVSNNAGASVIGGGDTNISSIQGDGSGNNQNAQYSVTIQCQAVENGPYLNDTKYDTLAFELFQEVKYQLKQADKSDFDGFSYVGELTPSGVERSSDAQDNSTETWAQYSGTVPVGALLVP
jgi:hypothetical protein